jgi:hypothetical protein
MPWPRAVRDVQFLRHQPKANTGQDEGKGRSKGAAFVKLRTHELAKKALAMTNRTMVAPASRGGRTVTRGGGDLVVRQAIVRRSWRDPHGKPCAGVSIPQDALGFDLEVGDAGGALAAGGAGGAGVGGEGVEDDEGGEGHMRDDVGQGSAVNGHTSHRGRGWVGGKERQRKGDGQSARSGSARQVEEAEEEDTREPGGGRGGAGDRSRLEGVQGWEGVEGVEVEQGRGSVDLRTFDRMQRRVRGRGQGDGEGVDGGEGSKAENSRMVPGDTRMVAGDTRRGEGDKVGAMDKRKRLLSCVHDTCILLLI